MNPNRRTQRQRNRIAWFCAFVALWMPWDAQLHGLWHAREALHDVAARAETVRRAPPGGALQHVAQACEQCLLFSALDAALPSHGVDLPSVAAAPAAPTIVATPRQAARFTAYRTRAPPLRA